MQQDTQIDNFNLEMRACQSTAFIGEQEMYLLKERANI